MCTLAVVFAPHRELRVVLGANRDEIYGREAAPPRWPSDVGYLAGTDLSALGGGTGGTWLGATPSGFFVGLTNQRSFGTRDRTKRSRGEVVRDALRRGSLESVLPWLLDLDPNQYSGFQLLLGDGSALYAAASRPDQARVETVRLSPGVHVLGNDRIGSADFPKADRIAEETRAAFAEKMASAMWGPSDALAMTRLMARVLANRAHPDPDEMSEPSTGSPFDRAFLAKLQATCIHTPVYGTVSSTLLTVDTAGLLTYQYADGPPSSTEYVSVYSRSLGGSPSETPSSSVPGHG